MKALVKDGEVEPEEVRVIGHRQLVHYLLRYVRVIHFPNLGLAVVIAGGKLFEPLLSRCHVTDAFLHISQVDHVVIALIVEKEAQLPLLLRYFRDVVVKALAIVIIGAFVRKFQILYHDGSESRLVALLEVLANLLTLVSDLLRLYARRAPIVLDNLSVDLLDLRILTIHQHVPLSCGNTALPAEVGGELTKVAAEARKDAPSRFPRELSLLLQDIEDTGWGLGSLPTIQVHLL